MSKKIDIKQKCPKCNKEIDISIFLTYEASEDGKDKKYEEQIEEMFKTKCKKCKNDIIHIHTVLYTDKTAINKYTILFSSKEEIEHLKKNFNLSGQSEFTIFRVCTNYTDFHEKIIILSESLSDKKIVFLKDLLLNQLIEDKKANIEDFDITTDEISIRFEGLLKEVNIDEKDKKQDDKNEKNIENKTKNIKVSKLDMKKEDKSKIKLEFTLISMKNNGEKYEEKTTVVPYELYENIAEDSYFFRKHKFGDFVFEDVSEEGIIE